MTHLWSFTKMLLSVGMPALIIASLLGMVTPPIAAASTLSQPSADDFSCRTFNIPDELISDGDGGSQNGDGYRPLTKEGEQLAKKKCEERYKALVQHVNRLKELIQRHKSCTDHPADCGHDKLNQLNKAIMKEKHKFNNLLGQYHKCREKFPNLPEAPSLP